MMTVGEIAAWRAARDAAARKIKEERVAANLAKLAAIEAAGSAAFAGPPGERSDYEVAQINHRAIIRADSVLLVDAEREMNAFGRMIARFLGVACDSCRTELYETGRMGHSMEIVVAGCCGCGRSYDMPYLDIMILPSAPTGPGVAP